MKKELPLIPSSNEIGFEARKILRNSTSVVIGTTDRDEGYAYTSFCAIAPTLIGEAVFLWSDLSDHRQNVLADPRISILCEQASHRTNPQAGARVTLVGTVEVTDDAALKDVFLQKHPSAKLYADFADFNFFKFKLEKAHYVGGFGKAVWVERDHFLCDETHLDALVSMKESVQVRRFVAKELSKTEDEVDIARIDPDGIDVRHQGKNIRIDFAQACRSLADFEKSVAS